MYAEIPNKGNAIAEKVIPFAAAATAKNDRTVDMHTEKLNRSYTVAVIVDANRCWCFTPAVVVVTVIIRFIQTHIYASGAN